MSAQIRGFAFLGELQLTPEYNPHGLVFYCEAIMLARVVKLAGLVVTIACWRRALNAEAGQATTVLLIAGAPLLAFPISLLGRYSLDTRPTMQHAQWTNVIVHYAMMIILGVSIFPAIQIVSAQRHGGIPFPTRLGIILVLVTGIATAFTVINLAWRGLGAPFAVKLSSRLATDWMYAFTRNPMLLCTLALLASVGLRYGSAWFLAWLAVCIAPGWVFFIKVYEERELAIRFGASYLEYKSRTPILWPRRSKVAEHRRSRKAGA